MPQHRSWSAVNAVCNTAPSNPPSKSSSAPSPEEGIGVQTSTSHTILIWMHITTSWHKTQNIKLKKRNRVTSKSALTDGMYAHRSISCHTHRAHFQAPTSQNSTFPPVFAFSKQHLAFATASFWQGRTSNSK